MSNNSLFVKGKGPILTEYLRTRKKLGDAVAGRGFSFEPGFMYDAQNELEIDVKSQLSALNYQLLEQAIAQELKQSGLDYDLAFKNAMIAWESDKQVLLTDWDREISNAKQVRAEDEEALNIIAAELGRRAITLMEAKTAIELEAEGYRLQMEQLDDQTADYEVALANAKLSTALKKLEVIPYLEQIIDIEQDIVSRERRITDIEAQFPNKIEALIDKERLIVDMEQQIAGKEAEVVTEEGVLIGKQQELLAEQYLVVDKQTELLAAETIAVNLRESLVRPALTLLVTKMDEYVAELAIQLSLYEDIATAKAETIGVKEEIATKQAEIVAQRQLLSEATTALVSLTGDLIDWKVEYLGGALSALIAVLEEYGGSFSAGGGAGSLLGGGGGGGGQLEQQILLKTQIAEVRKEIEMLVGDKVDGELEVDAAEVLYEQQKNLLAAAELSIKTLQAQNELLRAQQAEGNLITYATEWTETEGEIITEKENTTNTVIQYVTDERTQEQDTRVDAQTTVSDAQINAITERGQAEREYRRDLADIQVEAQSITASLTHLLRQD